MKNNLQALFKNYTQLFPEESSVFPSLEKQIASEENIFDRKNFTGHVTASALLISPSGKVLLLFHNKLKKFLQPGGHIENEDEDIMDAAKREAMEEAGLKNIVLHEWCVKNNSPILIDTHEIPKNEKKDEDAHFHHDFMFIFTTQNEDIILDESEVSDFKWVSVQDIINDNSNAAKAVKKMLKLGLI